MLGQQAVFWGVAAALLGVYCKYQNVTITKTPQQVEAQLLSYAGGARDAFIVYSGCVVFMLALVGWLGTMVVEVVAAIQRFKYKPSNLPALQPLPEEEREAVSTSAATPSSTHTAATSSNQHHALQNQQQQQQHKEESRRKAWQAAQQAQDENPAHTGAEADLQAQRERQPSTSSPASTEQQRLAALDQGRRRALEAYQKALDKQAAELKEKQLQLEQERRAQREAAARLAAEQAAAAAAAAAAAEQEAARRMAMWHQAVQQQSRYHGRQQDESAEGPAPTPGPASSSAAAAAAVAEVRSIRQEQDAEYQVSLAKDVAKQQERQKQLKQQRVKAKLGQLRNLLQERLGPEPAAAAAAASDEPQQAVDGDPDASDVLTIRVRLPNGSNQQRRFSVSSSFNEVQDWVFSLADMPLWQPGSWQLASSFPRRQLQPASGIWAMAAAAAAAHGSSNGSSSDAAEQLLDSWLIEDEDQQVQQVADGSSSSSSFLVCVKPVSDTAVMQLRVTGGMTVLQLMRKIQSRTGLTPDQQRLVFLGKVLEPSKTLDDYGVQPQHSLLLAAHLAGTAASHAPAAAGSDSFYAPMFEGDANSLLRAAAAGGDGSGDDAVEGAGSNVKLVPVPAVRRSSLGVTGQEEADDAADDSAAGGGGGGGGEAGGSSGSSKVLVVRDVKQLKSDVAHGAAQLALYVVMVFDDGAGSKAAAAAAAGSPAHQHTM